MHQFACPWPYMCASSSRFRDGSDCAATKRDANLGDRLCSAISEDAWRIVSLGCQVVLRRLAGRGVSNLRHATVASFGLCESQLPFPTRSADVPTA